jgi:hypothetical protein
MRIALVVLSKVACTMCGEWIATSPAAKSV